MFANTLATVQSSEYEQRPEPMKSNNSPWTEIFQDDAAQASQAQPAQRAHATDTMRAAHISTPSEADQPTHDALSAIFNQG